MNHLHDLPLLKKVVDEVFRHIVDKYGFSGYDAEISVDSINVSIRSEGLIVYAFINRREGIELLFRKSSWDSYKYRGFMSFLGKKFNSDEKRDEFLRAFLGETNKYEPYTYDSYKYRLLKEIEFVETYFPEVFKKKDLSIF
jgi:hypothetical protein